MIGYASLHMHNSTCLVTHVKVWKAHALEACVSFHRFLYSLNSDVQIDAVNLQISCSALHKWTEQYRA